MRVTWPSSQPRRRPARQPRKRARAPSTCNACTPAGVPVRRMPQRPSQRRRAGGRGSEAAGHRLGALPRSGIASWLTPALHVGRGGAAPPRRSCPRRRRAIASWARSKPWRSPQQTMGDRASDHGPCCARYRSRDSPGLAGATHHGGSGLALDQASCGYCPRMAGEGRTERGLGDAHGRGMTAL